MPYCLASMLVCGEVGLGQFTEEARRDPAVLAFRDRIRVEEDTCYTEEYPILRIESVEVFLKDGRRWIKEIELPEGKPSWEYIEKKYLSLCALTTQKETALRIKEQIISLTETSSMRTLGDEIRKELGDTKETR
jgi:2-methylcitrate dehydratase PrpD